MYVAPGASEAQVIEQTPSGKAGGPSDTLPTTVSEWWRKDLLELKDGFLRDLFLWAERMTGCRVESIKVCVENLHCVPRCLQISESGLPALK